MAAAGFIHWDRKSKNGAVRRPIDRGSVMLLSTISATRVSNRPYPVFGAALAVLVGAGLAATPARAQPHPLDGLTPQEITSTTEILRTARHATAQTLYPVIDLEEPAKEAVLAWKPGQPLERKARVEFGENGVFKEALVNLTKGTVERVEPIKGQPMVLYDEFMAAFKGVLTHPDMIKGLAARGIKPEEAFCLPLTAGNFFTAQYKGSRLMKVPCYRQPEASGNFYSRPIEGLFATYDIGKKAVVRVEDTGIVPVPQDPWDYTEVEVAKRSPLRPEMNPATLSQPGGPNFKINGSEISWDIWKFNYRIDKRPGMVLNRIMVNDEGNWRSVLYQAHLSEVFVPYSDPSKAWYFRSYMDSGEYGFGAFLTPLRPGIDCPKYATMLPAVISDDNGKPQEIPNAICIFERDIGEPAWRHYEIFAQTPDKPVPPVGRPETELVVRTSSEIGNYDYFIDYRFKQNGQIFIMVGASGLDAVKGVAARSMSDPTAKKDTEFGTLIAPNLVAPNHDHYFNFRLDFDIDQPVNHFHTMDIVRAKPVAGSPRRSMWKVDIKSPHREMEARYRISSLQPRFFQIGSGQTGPYGNHSGWMVHHANVANSPYDFVKDPPMMRNAYIEYNVWTTVYDRNQRYAGGKFPMQSDGKDTLAQWVKANRPLHGQDLVMWVTAGFQHIARTEDWPVMSTDWKTIHIMPHNVFKQNPALTIRDLKQ